MSTYLAYVSSATHLLSHGDLHALLEECQVNNRAAGITGALLYQDGNFMQILESDEDAVLDGVFNRIAADDRHRDVQTIIRRSTPERQFAEWSMAFRDLSGAAGELAEGYSDFFNHRHDPEFFGDQPNSAQRLLLSFRRTLNPPPY